eukprot:g25615.t1
MNDGNRGTLENVFKGWRQEVAKSAELRQGDEQLRQFNDAQIYNWLKKRRLQIEQVKSKQELSQWTINTLSNRGPPKPKPSSIKLERREGERLAKSDSPMRSSLPIPHEHRRCETGHATCSQHLFGGPAPRAIRAYRVRDPALACIGARARRCRWRKGLSWDERRSVHICQDHRKVIGAMTAVVGLLVVSIAISLVSLNFKQTFIEEKAKLAIQKCQRSRCTQWRDGQEIDEKLQIFEDRSQERERELNSIA